MCVALSVLTSKQNLWYVCGGWGVHSVSSGCFYCFNYFLTWFFLWQCGTWAEWEERRIPWDPPETYGTEAPSWKGEEGKKLLGEREGLTCPADIAHQLREGSPWFREPWGAIAAWGLKTTRLYLINLQPVLDEVSQGIQSRQTLNGLKYTLFFFCLFKNNWMYKNLSLVPAGFWAHGSWPAVKKETARGQNTESICAFLT